jgi:hypothetical protein
LQQTQNALVTYQPLRERAKQEQRVGEIEILALMGFRVRYSYVIRDAYFFIYIYLGFSVLTISSVKTWFLDCNI